jgi:hypothetical protein
MTPSGWDVGSSMKRLAGAVFIASILIVTAGCSVSKSMLIRTGEDPVHKDNDVRFRTTYYFRVFDACEGLSEVPNPNARTDTVLGGVRQGPYHLRTDSLYRFRMTGKAYALFQRIHFESGTLRKEEIDPFGSNVVFDSKTNRFAYKSREETEHDVRREARFLDIERLTAFKATLKGNEAALKALDDIILKQISTLAPVDVVSSEELRRGTTGMPTVLAGFAAARDRTQRFVQDIGVLRETVVGLAGAFDKAEAAARTRATDLYGPVAGQVNGVKNMLAERVADTPRLLEGVPSPAGDAATGAVEGLRRRLSGPTLTALPEAFPAADVASRVKTAVEELDKTIAALRASVGDAREVLTALDRLRKTVPQADVVSKLEVDYTRAETLQQRLGELLATSEKARLDVGRLATAIKGWQTVTGLKTQRDNLQAALAPPTDGVATVQQRAQAAVGDLDAIVKAAQDSVTAATDAWRLFHDTAATFDDKKKQAELYGAKAAILVNEAKTRRSNLAEGLKALRKSISEAEQALSELTGGDLLSDVNVAGARTALGEVLGQLSRIATAWSDVDESVLTQAEAATQIAATMTQGRRAGAALAAPSAPAAANGGLVSCPSGTTARRGFQILGPEGWRTFDQDERLIMAMSSSAKPLLGALQEVSRNVLNAQQSPADTFLPLLRERLRIVETERKAERYEATGGTVDDIVADLVATFGQSSVPGVKP